MLSGIYTITCDNKIYLGKTKDLEFRKSQHFRALRRNKHPNHHLQCAFNKYGESSFSFEILEIYPIKYLSSMEHYWANLLNVHDKKYGYNIRPTHPEDLFLLSNETKIKIGISNKGKKKNGSKWAKEKRQNLIDNPRSWSLEERMKLSISRKNSLKAKEAINKLRKSIKVTIDNIEYNYDSVTEFCRKMNFRRSSIQRCLKNKNAYLKKYFITYN